MQGNRKDTLERALAEQGFGTRKECRQAIQEGGVEIGRVTSEGLSWELIEDPEAQADLEGAHIRMLGTALPYHRNLYLAFNKPDDTEVSHTPSHHQSVFAYFPEPYMRRGLEAVGRLDFDTTGLLFFSDSGAFNHFLTSPKKQVAKTYRVGTKHPITAEQVAKLTAGIELRGEDAPTLPARVEILAEKSCDLTIMEGKYHQVKRMFGAASNRVETIHRIAIGPIQLGEDLAPGTWRHLSSEELAQLGFRED